MFYLIICIRDHTLYYLANIRVVCDDIKSTDSLVWTQDRLQAIALNREQLGDFQLLFFGTRADIMAVDIK